MTIRENLEKVFKLNLPDFFELVVENLEQYVPPLTLEFSNCCDVLEVQYFLDLTKPENYYLEEKLLVFAISYDGHKLMFDLKTESLEIFQDELGDIYELELNAKDLIYSVKNKV